MYDELTRSALHLRCPHGPSGLASATVSATDEGGWTEALGLELDRATLALVGLESDSSLSFRLCFRTSWLSQYEELPQAEIHRLTVDRPSAASPHCRVWGHDHVVEVVDSRPSHYDVARAGHELTKDERYAVADAQDAVDEERSPNHQFVGYASPIQFDVWADLERETEDADPAAFDQLNKLDHTLLFQVDSERPPGLMVGDFGRLYVVIPADDLKNLRFDRTVTCMQMS